MRRKTRKIHPFELLSNTEKISVLNKILNGYPENHIETGKIKKQIKKLKMENKHDDILHLHNGQNYEQTSVCCVLYR